MQSGVCACVCTPACRCKDVYAIMLTCVYSKHVPLGVRLGISVHMRTHVHTCVGGQDQRLTREAQFAQL